LTPYLTILKESRTTDQRPRRTISPALRASAVQDNQIYIRKLIVHLGTQECKRGFKKFDGGIFGDRRARKIRSEEKFSQKKCLKN